MSLLEGIIDSRNNPLAVVEDIAADNNWSFERSGEDDRMPGMPHATGGLTRPRSR